MPIIAAVAAVLVVAVVGIVFYVMLRRNDTAGIIDEGDTPYYAVEVGYYIPADDWPYDYGYDTANYGVTGDMWNEPVQDYHFEGTQVVIIPNVQRTTISVADENELRAAVGQAEETPTEIILTADIELISDFSILGGSNIMITSTDGQMFSLVATRDMATVTVREGASLIIENISVVRTEGTNGTGIINHGIVNMDNCIVSGHTASGIVNYGSFLMSNSTVSYNSVERNFTGGGVTNHSNFVVNDSTIRNNIGGGGIFSTMSLTIRRSTISNNSADRYGGGVNTDGYFFMIGSEITGNTARNGGGVYNAGNFIMFDGGIYGNTGHETGGGIRNIGNFTMHDGNISYNTIGHGNGSAVVNTSSFTMYHGIVSGNAGGTTISNSSNLIMHSGTISNNDTRGFERLVIYYNYVWSRNYTLARTTISNIANFVMIDGLITNNDGSGVVSYGNESVFSMYGGIIRNNMLTSGYYYYYDWRTTDPRQFSGDVELLSFRYKEVPGVRIGHGAFNMNGGVIYNHNGNGVYGLMVHSFIINSGTIQNNTNSGVHISDSNFLMNNGIIQNNGGSGVVQVRGMLSLYSGTINNNAAYGINHTAGDLTINGGWIFDNAYDITIGTEGTYINNVFDPNVGAIGSPPPEGAVILAH